MKKEIKTVEDAIEFLDKHCNVANGKLFKQRDIAVKILKDSLIKKDKPVEEKIETVAMYLNMHDPGTELVIHDKDYDTEYYMYSHDKDEELDDWDKAMDIIASKLKVVKGTIHDGSTILTANMGELIEKSMNNLKEADLFNYYDVDHIMDDINPIMSGEVSEKWMMKFANALVTE